MSEPISSIPRWELAAENIAVKIRWIGVLVGYLAVNVGPIVEHRPILNAILALGAAYTMIDTACSLRGKVFLGDYPLTISAMESLFIGLLCYFHTGLESPFRYYFILSLICCAIRHSARVTLLTCCLQWLSCLALFLSQPAGQRDLLTLLLILVVLGWVTWAASAMSLLLKRFSEHLGQLNSALRRESEPARRRESTNARGNCRNRRPMCCTRKRWRHSDCSPPASPTRSAIR